MATETVPVIVCDGCRRVTPARFGMSVTNPAGVSAAERERQLVKEGWKLSAERDTCPDCTKREARK